MCGIAGVIDLRGAGRLPSPAVVDAMTDALARRGPDGRGTWRSKNAALGHRRLAIIDTTDAGLQPMVHHEDPGLAIVFNGEIYNYRELRKELVALGHTFVSRSDTEVLLAAWRQWGPACTGRLNGIFAFVVVDGQRVFLARDHAGIKPLFYSHEAGVLRFGSEIKALLADPAQPRRPRAFAIDSFLAYGYVPQPLTAFEGIHQLAAGHAVELRIGRDGDIAPAAFFHLDPREEPQPFDVSVERLGAALRDAVRRQLVSDVPLGAFLSGGLDSASVVREMVAAHTGTVRTFSLGFTEATYDERAAAAETARILGTVHQADVVDLDLRGRVLDIAETNDDLLADGSLIAVDALCKATRAHVTVALSGDGADEMLAGYPTYAATYLARAWRRVPGVLRRAARGGAERLPASTARYNLREFAGRFLRGAERGSGADFASWRIYLDDAVRDSVLRAPSERTPLDVVLAPYADAVTQSPGETLLKRMLCADLGFYLPSDMLVKVDRASMRHGLEVRVPFLDPEVMQLALAMPTAHLLTWRGVTKAALRAHVERHVSPVVAHRKKRGFNVPLSAAFLGPLGDLLLDAVRSAPFSVDGPLDAHGVERLLKAHRARETDAGFALYAILVLALFWQRFLAPR